MRANASRSHAHVQTFNINRGTLAAEIFVQNIGQFVR